MVCRAEITRDTNETKIRTTLNLDGTGQAEVHTGIGFSDHVLHGFARHGLFDLQVSAEDDLEVDTHHTIEDIGIVLEKTTRETVGDKKGIVRYDSKIPPIDEALILCAPDLCGRPYLVYDLTLDWEKMDNLEIKMICESFCAVSYGAEMNLHLKQLSGINNHHIIKAAFKVFAKSLDEATRHDERTTDVLSTKGSLQKVERIYEEIAKIRRRDRVQKIVLFGSRARNTNHEKSDTDIAVCGYDDFKQFRHKVEGQT